MSNLERQLRATLLMVKQRKMINAQRKELRLLRARLRIADAKLTLIDNHPIPALLRRQAG